MLTRSIARSTFLHVNSELSLANHWYTCNSSNKTYRFSKIFIIILASYFGHAAVRNKLVYYYNRFINSANIKVLFVMTEIFFDYGSFVPVRFSEWVMCRDPLKLEFVLQWEWLSNELSWLISIILNRILRWIGYISTLIEQ